MFPFIIEVIKGKMVWCDVYDGHKELVAKVEPHLQGLWLQAKMCRKRWFCRLLGKMFVILVFLLFWLFSFFPACDLNPSLSPPNFPPSLLCHIVLS